jgi:hypothetical protein
MQLPIGVRMEHVQRLIMASPDVDRAKAINEVPLLGIPVTIYGSTRDQALTISWRDHGLPRAGDLSNAIVGHTPDFTLASWAGVDVVDTSGVDRSIVGHSDYISTPEGAADLCRVVNGEPTRVDRTRDPRGGKRLHWLLVSNQKWPQTDRCASGGLMAFEWLVKKQNSGE